MAQHISKPVAELVAAAKAEIEELDVDAVQSAVAAGGVQLVDIRDVRELRREGRIADAFHCPRGMLEFWIDPASPYAKPVFTQSVKYVFFCAGGMRSALAAKTAQDMGLAPVAHLIGGFSAWKAAGAPVQEDEKR